MGKIIKYRKAKLSDSKVVSSFIFEASKDLLTYCYRFRGIDVRDFLEFDFRRGKGIFGYQNFIVALDEEKVIGAFMMYEGRLFYFLTFHTVLSTFLFFRFKVFSVFLRMFKMNGLFQIPRRDSLYTGNAFVSSEFRGQGVFRGLVNEAKAFGRERKLKAIECDVSHRNTHSYDVHIQMRYKVLQRNPYRGENPLLDGSDRFIYNL